MRLPYIYSGIKLLIIIILVFLIGCNEPPTIVVENIEENGSYNIPLKIMINVDPEAHVEKRLNNKPFKGEEVNIYGKYNLNITASNNGGTSVKNLNFTVEPEQEMVINSVTYIYNIYLRAGQDEFSLPDNVEVTLNNEENALIPVRWEKSIPEYNPDRVGLFAFEGNLDLTDFNNIIVKEQFIPIVFVVQSASSRR